MKWDKKGAINTLDAKKCFVCEEFKPIYVVVTLHGKKDIHIPCCSEECLNVVSETALNA